MHAGGGGWRLMPHLLRLSLAYLASGDPVPDADGADAHGFGGDAWWWAAATVPATHHHSKFLRRVDYACSRTSLSP